MKFALFTANLSLATRAFRVWLSAECLRVAAVALRLSKRIVRQGNSQVPTSALPLPTSSGASLTVVELLAIAARWPSSVFVLRLPNALIEITHVNEMLETAAFSSGSEGHLVPRSQPGIIVKFHRSTDDKEALDIPPPGFIQ